MPTYESLATQVWPTIATSPADLIVLLLPRMMVGKIGAPGGRIRPLTVSFVRLAARAIADYNRAGAAATQSGPASDFLMERIEAISDLESCILTLHRSLLFLEVLRQRGLATAAGEAVPLRPANIPALATGARDRVRDLRDAIAHMDARIKSGEFPTGRSTAPWPDSQGIVTLENVKVSTAELASWLKQVADIATFVALEGASSSTGAA